MSKTMGTASGNEQPSNESHDAEIWPIRLFLPG